MKYFTFAIFLVSFGFSSSATIAEDDAMEFQRCIWRCMHNTPGWDGRNSKAYNRCISSICEEEDKERSRKKKRRQRFGGL